MKERSPITTHVLDTSRGRPAEGVDVVLEERDGDKWKRLGAGFTNADGRVETLLPVTYALKAGHYRLTFATGPYLARLGGKAFYPEVVIPFEVFDPKQHYHVPLLLSGFGYSTYRGS